MRSGVLLTLSLPLLLLIGPALPITPAASRQATIAPLVRAVASIGMTVILLHLVGSDRTAGAGIWLQTKLSGA